MISFSNEEQLKIELLEKLFLSFSVKDLTELTEREEIVAKLKGIDTSKHVFQHIINEHTSNQLELISLRTDMQALVKAVNGLYNQTIPYSQELQTLKSKYGVY